MPIHIDNIDTSIELVDRPEPVEQPVGTAVAAAPPIARTDLRDEMLRILGDELERYARMRGH